MSIAVTCPQCQASIDVSDDSADVPIRCQRCAHTFERHAHAIQSGPPPRAETPRPQKRPTFAFPLVPMLVVVCGILLLLLILSGGLNVWLVSGPEGRGHRAIEEARRAEEQARMLQMQVEQARQMQVHAEKKQAELQQRIDELQRQNDALRDQLDRK